MFAVALAAAFAGGGFLALTDRSEIVVARPAIMLADVVPAATAKRLGSLAAREIARLPIGRDRLSLSRRAVAVLVHRADPALDVDAGADGTITFRLVRNKTADAGPCLVTSAPLAAGTAVSRDKVAKGACAPVSAGLRFDTARHVLVARRDLPAGSPLGRLVAAPAEAVARGDAMTLVSRAGPVTIERPVTALQPGREGGRVFVRDSAGHIFAAPIAKAGQ